MTEITHHDLPDPHRSRFSNAVSALTHEFCPKSLMMPRASCTAPYRAERATVVSLPLERASAAVTDSDASPIARNEHTMPVLSRPPCLVLSAPETLADLTAWRGLVGKACRHILFVGSDFGIGRLSSAGSRHSSAYVGIDGHASAATMSEWIELHRQGLMGRHSWASVGIDWYWVGIVRHASAPCRN